VTAAADARDGQIAVRDGDGSSASAAHPEIWRDGLLAGLDPADLAARFDTPLYVYDLDAVAERARILRAALPARCDIAYAVKANPSLAVIGRLAAEGIGADVSSEGELEAAQRAGVAHGSVVVTGPGKSDALIRSAVSLGVRAVVVESPLQLERVEATARTIGVRAPVLLRLAHPDERELVAGHHSEQSGSHRHAPEAAFGMSWEDAVACAERAARSLHLDLLGVHAFAVSATLDPEALAGRVRVLVEAGRWLARQTGFSLRLVDAGGGLGIPYGDGQPPLDLSALAARFADLDSRWTADPDLDTVRVLLEPGRFLAGPAGAYLARVIDTRWLDGRCIAVLDGGINHLLAPALVGRSHRLRLVGAGSVASGALAAEPLAAHGTIPVVFTGPLCTPLDVVGRRDAVAEPQPGDLLVALDAGAYGFTESMPWFLSHPGPAEVGASAGRADLIRPRLNPLDVLDAQRLPEWQVSQAQVNRGAV
jgi:diaminopimelate decarboxylase